MDAKFKLLDLYQILNLQHTTSEKKLLNHENEWESI